MTVLTKPFGEKKSEKLLTLPKGLVSGFCRSVLF